MLKLAQLARFILATVFTAMFVPVVTDMSRRYAEKQGWIEHPEQAAGWLMSVLLAVAQWPWFYPMFALVGGLTAGAWLDWLLRKFDGSREARRRTLGWEMVNLANAVQQEGPNLHYIRPRVTSLFIKIHKARLWHPSYEVFRLPTGFLPTYLRMVGQLLADGHFREARVHSLQAKEAFEQQLKEQQK
jgi:hypothetical protein